MVLLVCDKANSMDVNAFWEAPGRKGMAIHRQPQATWACAGII